MDKNAVKKFAVWARGELIQKVTQKAQQYGIEKNIEMNSSLDSVNGVILTDTEKKQRQALIKKISDEDFDRVMEEVAYTWFNRFIALRFMEVNGYLPSHIRVFSDENNGFNPQILTEAIHLEFMGLDKNRVFDMKSSNQNEELFKYLLIVQCNDLNKILPEMFQKISDYTELLLPDYLLREGSVIEQLVTVIPEKDWTDQVQIIGWIYQYYIGEPKDELINARKQYKNVDIPYVTQLFTSDWIVRFIVQNSLGRIWIEGHDDQALASSLEYYLSNSEKNPEEVQTRIAHLEPKDIKVIDPCCGSGHMIAYAFDLLVKIYESYGFAANEAASLIVENNIYALDIDPRAAQLANFSVYMKARQYDRRFFRKQIKPNVYAIPDSNEVSMDILDYFNGGNKKLEIESEKLVTRLKNASLYGSIINTTDIDFELLNERIVELDSDISIFKELAIQIMEPLIKAGEVLSRRYTVIVTNPPYMATKYMPNLLKEYITEKYAEYKSDLFSVFIVRCSELCEEYGQLGFLTPYVWMFIQSYEKLRAYVLDKMTFSSLVQLEYNAFEAACVPVSAFTFKNYSVEGRFECVKLSDFRGIDNQAPKTLEAVSNKECGYRYSARQDNFSKIPGSPIAYWISDRFVRAFDQGISVEELSDFTGSQHITANNDKYLRLFWEINHHDIGQNKHWAYYAKGGEYRKWYGDVQLVVDTSVGAMSYYKECKTANCLNEKYWFQEGITYSAITSSGTGFRYYPAVGGFDKGGPTICRLEHMYYVLGILNSSIAEEVFQIMNPTINLQVKDVKAMPIIIDDSRVDEVEKLVKENIQISKDDWDSYEGSFDFKRNPLVGDFETIEEAYRKWESQCQYRFNKLKENEERLNAIFMEVYGVTESDVTVNVPDEKITVSKANLETDIKNLISYAVGCMFGRYSLDFDGVVCSGDDFSEKQYSRYKADKDNIIPICNDEYFEYDIVGRFVEFIDVVYGHEHLEENLRFISNALGINDVPRNAIRQYFISDFFNDHCSTYAVTGLGKRPIYWLFDSGKKNGFKCLIYINRYEPDVIARIRTDYVHEQQSRYSTELESIQEQLTKVSGSEKVKLNKRYKTIKEQDEELHGYEEQIHHIADEMIKLDINDGFKYNYAILDSVTAKIK